MGDLAEQFLDATDEDSERQLLARSGSSLLGALSTGNPQIDGLIVKHASAEGVDPKLIAAMMHQESGGHPHAVSPKGASGLMQLIPATAKRFGVRDIFDPDQNIQAGTKYVRWLSDRYKGDLDKVLAGYNAGEGNVDKYGGIPPFAETQKYVPAIKSRYLQHGGQWAAPTPQAAPDLPNAEDFLDGKADLAASTPPSAEDVVDGTADIGLASPSADPEKWKRQVRKAAQREKKKLLTTNPDGSTGYEALVAGVAPAVDSVAQIGQALGLVDAPPPGPPRRISRLAGGQRAVDGRPVTDTRTVDVRRAQATVSALETALSKARDAGSTDSVNSLEAMLREARGRLGVAESNEQIARGYVGQQATSPTTGDVERAVERVKRSRDVDLGDEFANILNGLSNLSAQNPSIVGLGLSQAVPATGRANRELLKRYQHEFNVDPYTKQGGSGVRAYLPNSPVEFASSIVSGLTGVANQDPLGDPRFHELSPDEQQAAMQRIGDRNLVPSLVGGTLPYLAGGVAGPASPAVAAGVGTVHSLSGFDANPMGLDEHGRPTTLNPYAPDSLTDATLEGRAAEGALTGALQDAGGKVVGSMGDVVGRGFSPAASRLIGRVSAGLGGLYGQLQADAITGRTPALRDGLVAFLAGAITHGGGPKELYLQSADGRIGRVDGFGRTTIVDPSTVPHDAPVVDFRSVAPEGRLSFDAVFSPEGEAKPGVRGDFYRNFFDNGRLATSNLPDVERVVSDPDGYREELLTRARAAEAIRRVAADEHKANDPDVAARMVGDAERAADQFPELAQMDGASLAAESKVLRQRAAGIDEALLSPELARRHADALEQRASDVETRGRDARTTADEAQSAVGDAETAAKDAETRLGQARATREQLEQRLAEIRDRVAAKVQRGEPVSLDETQKANWAAAGLLKARDVERQAGEDLAAHQQAVEAAKGNADDLAEAAKAAESQTPAAEGLRKRGQLVTERAQKALEARLGEEKRLLADPNARRDIEAKVSTALADVASKAGMSDRGLGAAARLVVNVADALGGVKGINPEAPLSERLAAVTEAITGEQGLHGLFRPGTGESIMRDGARAAFDTSSGGILLGKDADALSVVHELLHAVRNRGLLDPAEDAALTEWARAYYRANRDTVLERNPNLRRFSEADRERWGIEEVLAGGLESILRDGRLPDGNRAAEGAFADLARIGREIYSPVFTSHLVDSASLPADVRTILGNLVGSDLVNASERVVDPKTGTWKPKGGDEAPVTYGTPDAQRLYRLGDAIAAGKYASIRPEIEQLAREFGTTPAEARRYVEDQFKDFRRQLRGAAPGDTATLEARLPAPTPNDPPEVATLKTVSRMAANGLLGARTKAGKPNPDLVRVQEREIAASLSSVLGRPALTPDVDEHLVRTMPPEWFEAAARENPEEAPRYNALADWQRELREQARRDAETAETAETQSATAVPAPTNPAPPAAEPSASAAAGAPPPANVEAAGIVDNGADNAAPPAAATAASTPVQPDNSADNSAANSPVSRAEAPVSQAVAPNSAANAAATPARPTAPDVIPRTPVVSSNIASIGYHPESRTLAVEFRNGGVYHYPDVSPEQFDALQSAESIGSHFARNHRNAPRFEKVAGSRPTFQAWTAGENRGGVEFADPVHRQLFNLGAELRRRTRGGQNKSTDRPNKKIDALVAPIAEQTGLTPAQVHMWALDVHKDVREQMAGVGDGETRKVENRIPRPKFEAPKADLPPAPPPVALGNTAPATTERGTTVETRYAVVNARDLVTSHDTTMRQNPAYPAELQPRDRSRAASAEQVARIASDLRPEFLGESPKAADGAPIVGPDNVVESGNGRTIALRSLYEQGHGNGEKYKAWLVENAARFGLDPEAVKAAGEPVLVRVRQTEVDRPQFAREANESSVAAMSATEQATSDANHLDDELLSSFVPNDDGNLNSAANADFRRAFFERAVSPTDRGRYVRPDGTISQEGLARIRNAIFARAYGDTRAIEMMAESTDPNVKNVLTAMTNAAPRLASMRGAIERGSLYDLDISEDVAEAVAKLSALRESGQKVDEYVKQQGLFGAEMSPIALDLLKIFDGNKQSARRLTDVLVSYAHGVEALGDPRQVALFSGGAPEPSQADILAAALAEATSKGKGNGQEEAQVLADQQGGGQTDARGDQTATSASGAGEGGGPVLAQPGRAERDAGWWFSQAERAVDSIFGSANTVKADSLPNLLERGGVKPEEIRDLGLDELARSRRGQKLTREDVREVLDANRLEVREIERTRDDRVSVGFEFPEEVDGDPDAKDMWFIRTNRALKAAGLPTFNAREWREGSDGWEALADPETAARIVRVLDGEGAFPRIDDAPGTDETKFHDYTEPGGRNYREITMHLPARDGGDVETAHWDEPNTIAHVRLKDDRGRAGEKILRVEEIQSDWHQAGARKGYLSPEERARVDEHNREDARLTGLRRAAEARVEKNLVEIGREAFRARNGHPPTDVPDGSLRSAAMEVRRAAETGTTKFWQAAVDDPKVRELLAEHDRLTADRQKAADELATMRAKAPSWLFDRMPDAPLKKSWHEFVLKRLLKLAADEGYDQIRIVGGKTQTERYNLSKVVDSIGWTKNADGTISLRGRKDGKSVFTKDDLLPEEVPDHIGKGLAETIESSDEPDGDIDGLDLEVGRAGGMRAFYDEKVPGFLNRYLKKYGTRVRTDEAGDHYLDVSPAVRQAFGEPVALYAPKTAAARAQEASSEVRTDQARRGLLSWIASSPGKAVRTVGDSLKANVLTGLATQLTNLGSNVGQAVNAEARDAQAAPIDMLVQTLWTGKRSRTWSPRNSVEALGVTLSLKDAPGDQPLNRQRMVELQRGGLRKALLELRLIPKPEGKLSVEEEASGPVEMGRFGIFPKLDEKSVAGLVTRFNDHIFSTLEAGDAVAYTYHLRKALGDASLAKAKNDGLKGRDAWAYSRELMQSPNDDLVDTATAQALMDTFKNSTAPYEFVAGMRKAMSKTDGNFGAATRFAIDMLIPFAKTPSSILVKGFDLMGGSALRAGADAVRLRRLIKDGALEDFDRLPEVIALQRHMTGHAANALTGLEMVGGLFLTGLVAGAHNYIEPLVPEEDERAKSDLRQQGMGFKGGRIRIGGYTFDLASAGPVGSLMLAAAAAGQAYRRTGRWDDAALGALGQAGLLFLDSPLMQGTHDLYSLVSDFAKAQSPDARLSKDGQYGLSRFAASQAQRFVPASSLVGSIARATDVDRKADTFTDMVKAGIPGLRQDLPAKQNPLTGETEQGRGVLNFLPFSPQRDRSDDTLVRVAVDFDLQPPKPDPRKGEDEATFARRSARQKELWREALKVYAPDFTGFRDAVDADRKKAGDLLRDRISKYVEARLKGEFPQARPLKVRV